MKPLCQLSDIPDGEARAFSIDKQHSCIVARLGLNVFAYLNRCPHAGVELQWGDNKLMSLDGSQLQCSTHGALFNVDNGYCTWGPCQGQRLRALPITLENGLIYLENIT